jgi:hypothetical protein
MRPLCVKLLRQAGAFALARTGVNTSLWVRSHWLDWLLLGEAVTPVSGTKLEK